jgi:hypothetical protein
MIVKRSIYSREWFFFVITGNGLLYVEFGHANSSIGGCLDDSAFVLCRVLRNLGHLLLRTESLCIIIYCFDSNDEQWLHIPGVVWFGDRSFRFKQILSISRCSAAVFGMIKSESFSKKRRSSYELDASRGSDCLACPAVLLAFELGLCMFFVVVNTVGCSD